MMADSDNASHFPSLSAAHLEWTTKSVYERSVAIKELQKDTRLADFADGP